MTAYILTPALFPKINCRLTKILLTSSSLHRVLPEVRLRALIETASAQKDDVKVCEIVLDNLCSWPHLADDKKLSIVEYCLNQEWDNLCRTLKCQEYFIPSYECIRYPTFSRFRAMVVCIYSRSQKINLLPDSRKRELGALIHSATTVDELMNITLQSLEQSALFDNATKEMILNDILDARYDRLLLASRFDCEDEPCALRKKEDESLLAALMEQKEQELASECPVCLGLDEVDRLLPCGHELCEKCILDWVRVQGEPCPCPLCRQVFSVDSLQQLHESRARSDRNTRTSTFT